MGFKDWLDKQKAETAKASTTKRGEKTCPDCGTTAIVLINVLKLNGTTFESWTCPNQDCKESHTDDY